MGFGKNQMKTSQFMHQWFSNPSFFFFFGGGVLLKVNVQHVLSNKKLQRGENGCSWMLLFCFVLWL